MKAQAPSGQCLTVLEALQCHGWRYAAWQMNGLGMLNERGRISDLRHRWGVEIVAETTCLHGQQRTTYVVPPSSRARATELIEAGERIMGGVSE